MKKFAALCVILIAPFLTILLQQQPAQAAWSELREANDCTQCADENINLEVWYKRDQDNVGFYLSMVTIQGCYWPCSSVDGTSLKCMNQNGVVVWSKPGDQINLGTADDKSWTPGLTMDHATELKCVYKGRAHIRLRPDWDFTDTVDRT